MFKWADSGEESLEMVADELPDTCGVKPLCRTGCPMLEYGRYTRQNLFDMAFDVLRQVRLEQVGLPSFFQWDNEGVRSEATVTATYLWLPLGRHGVDNPQQSRQAVLAREFVSGANPGANDQMQAGHELDEISVRGTPRLMRFARHHRAFPLAIQWNAGGVDIQYLRCIEQGRRALVQLRVQPGDALGFWSRAQRPSQRVLADCFAHAQQHRVDAITADLGNVRVPLVVRQYRQQTGVHYIALGRRIRADVGERKGFLPARPQAGERQEFDEIGQLPHRRCRVRSLPAHLYLASRRLQSSAGRSGAGVSRRVATVEHKARTLA